MSPASSTFRHHVTVKNTFVHIVEEDMCKPVQKRSCSTPAEMRLCHGSDTLLSLPKGSSRSSHSVATMRTPTDLGEPDRAEMRNGLGRSSGVEADEPPPTQELCTRPLRKGKTRFNVPAKAFAPSSEPQAQSFEHQVKVCVTLARSLASIWPVVGSEASESKTGWSVVLFVKKQDKMHCAQAIFHAKQALLEAAKGTTSVYMLGYDKKALIKVPDGVASVFWGVDPQSSPCWKLIRRGSCSPACTADHPQYRANVIFTVSLVD